MRFVFDYRLPTGSPWVMIFSAENEAKAEEYVQEGTFRRARCGLSKKSVYWNTGQVIENAAVSSTFCAQRASILSTL
jgi:hypothetical protein